MDEVLLDRIRNIAAAEVRAGRSPSVAIGVTTGQTTRYVAVAGTSDAATGRAAGPDTVYAVGSITKQFTAAAVRSLVADGLLNLDDGIGQYLGDCRQFADGVTIRDLLDHRSGFPSQHSLRLDVRRPVTVAELCHQLSSRPVKGGAHPYRYNNLNYLLLSDIIERVTGTTYAETIRTRVTEPLGLASTSYCFEQTTAGQRAVGYTGIPGHFRPAPRWDSSWLVGAGGLTSSLNDLMVWARHVLERPAMELAPFFRPPAPEDTCARYVMGWVVDRLGDRRCIWHNGEIAGFRAMCTLLPVESIAITVFCNVDAQVATYVSSPRHLTHAVANVFAGDIPFAATSPPTKMQEVMARVTDIFHRKHLAG